MRAAFRLDRKPDAFSGWIENQTPLSAVHGLHAERREQGDTLDP
jgi:hypothetical protein